MYLMAAMTIVVAITINKRFIQRISVFRAETSALITSMSFSMRSRRASTLVRRTSNAFISPLSRISRSLIALVSRKSSSLITPLSRSSSSRIAPLSRSSSSLIAPVSRTSSSLISPLSRSSSSLIAPVSRTSSSLILPVMPSPAFIKSARDNALSCCISVKISTMASACWSLTPANCSALKALCVFIIASVIREAPELR
ncbi:hypothetical protein GJV09_19860 [Enterobacteriaceae bacterium RIT702]|nr:hypothetical protein [Enterobacteriaceae bacterium RIT702]